MAVPWAGPWTIQDSGRLVLSYDDDAVRTSFSSARSSTHSRGGFGTGTMSATTSPNRRRSSSPSKTEVQLPDQDPNAPSFMRRTTSYSNKLQGTGETYGPSPQTYSPPIVSAEKHKFRSSITATKRSDKWLINAALQTEAGPATYNTVRSSFSKAAKVAPGPSIHRERQGRMEFVENNERLSNPSPAYYHPNMQQHRRFLPTSNRAGAMLRSSTAFSKDQTSRLTKFYNIPEGPGIIYDTGAHQFRDAPPRSPPRMVRPGTASRRDQFLITNS
eukprot:gnl/Hemi2/14609_TR4958_c0_g1_i1.p1 gnl/Hemi2/14609_TR4958_c0_g1~~gnl/Hemi2/14609_TR4958_c0_g1_i1.p1  ORF type:complete len:273 (+),score=34.14 gnl/Hemi2/14609_TR4958_c0_g1_i1:120-938(+)